MNNLKRQKYWDEQLRQWLRAYRVVDDTPLPRERDLAMTDENYKDGLKIVYTIIGCNLLTALVVVAMNHV